MKFEESRNKRALCLTLEFVLNDVHQEQSSCENDFDILHCDSIQNAFHLPSNAKNSMNFWNKNYYDTV